MRTYKQDTHNTHNTHKHTQTHTHTHTRASKQKKMNTKYDDCNMEIDDQNTEFHVIDEEMESHINVDIVTVTVTALILAPFILLTSYI